MIVLALDTATMAPTLAVTDGEKVLAEIDPPAGETHSRTLVPLIQKLLVEQNLAPGDVDLYAVGTGPGSFTGLRIGLAAAKGLAWAAGRPLAGIPTLDAMAAAYTDKERPICPLVDARKGQVYAAVYVRGGEGDWEKTFGPAALTAPALAASIKEPTVFFGEGLEKRAPELPALLGDNFVRGPHELDRPRARFIARLAVARRKTTETDPARIVPLYVRPPDIREPKS